MIITIAASALAVQLSTMPEPVARPLAQPVQYGGVPVRRPPCGHGWDLSARDGLCYPNGYLPPQTSRRDSININVPHRGGRYPVPCGHGADLDARDGLCYPTGTVPKQFRAEASALLRRRRILRTPSATSVLLSRLDRTIPIALTAAADPRERTYSGRPRLRTDGFRGCA